MGLAKPGKTRGLTGTGPDLAPPESAGRVFGRVWNRTDPFLQSKPGPLPGYPDPLLTLVEALQRNVFVRLFPCVGKVGFEKCEAIFTHSIPT